MHRVMLIDDDVPMVRYLEKIIDWNELNCTIIATAGSSIRAIKEFEKTMPDLVITDIGLPQKDGIELATEFRLRKPDVRVLFLTCHEDFNYAKQALHLKADDYLIKDNLTPEQLRQSVEKAVNNIKTMDDISVQVSYREELERHKDILKQSLLKQIKTGERAELAVVTGKKLGINLEHPKFVIGLGLLNHLSLVKAYTQNDLKLLRYAWYNIAQDVASRSNDAAIFQDDDGTLVFIWKMKSNLAVNVFDEIQEIIQELRTKTKEYLKLETYYQFSRQSTDLNGLGKLWKQLHTDSAAYYEDLEKAFQVISPGGEDSPLQPNPIRLLRERKDSILAACESHDFQQAELIWQEAASMAKQLAVEPSEWIADCSEMLRILEYQLGFMQEQDDFHTILRMTRRWSETTGLALFWMKNVTSASELKSSSPREPKMKIIEQYVHDHLSENISSVTLANHLYLNPSYFSRYFKKMAGVNFIDFVHEYKMKLAVQMLKNKEETVELVSMKLGYSDRTYFSKVFKKYNGVSPSELKSGK